MMRTACSMAILFVLLAACGGERDSDPAHAEGTGTSTSNGGLRVGGSLAWPSAEERRLAPDQHPTPYSTDQIRRGCPHGRTSTFRITARDTTLVQEWRFTDPDEQGVTWTTTPVDAKGEPTGESTARRQLWRDLQEHASYPAAATTVIEDNVQVPAGSFACMRYTVTETRDGATTVSTYWFARDLPGPPVKMEQHRDGVRIGSMEMIAHRMRG